MNTLKYYFKALMHYMLSHSRHGTHSPFVYKLADEVIYKSDPALLSNTVVSDKKFLMLSRILTFYADYQVICIACEPKLYDYLRLQRSSPMPQRAIADVEQLPSLDESTFYLLDEIYKDPAKEQFWNKLKANPEVTVTIDLFHFGLAFRRKQQRKENFKLRF